MSSWMIGSSRGSDTLSIQTFEDSKRRWLPCLKRAMSTSTLKSLPFNRPKPTRLRRSEATHAVPFSRLFFLVSVCALSTWWCRTSPIASIFDLLLFPKRAVHRCSSLQITCPRCPRSCPTTTHINSGERGANQIVDSEGYRAAFRSQSTRVLTHTQGKGCLGRLGRRF